MQAIPPADDVPINHPSDTSSIDGLSDAYDFIIIGGGTAGLVVAARLTEDPKIRVLVLEAGANKHNDPNILTPGLASFMLDNPKYDWEFSKIPQEALNGRVIPHARGKVLGGSSALYQHQLVYSSPSTFRAWAALGNPGWDFESMLPYLRKFHTHASPIASDTIKELEPISFQDAAVESSLGPIQTSYSPTGDIEKAWYETWQKIMKELGYNGEKLGGIIVPNGIDPKTRSRSYAATAFYSSEIASRPNLRVVTEAMVQKIIFSKEGTEVVALGVEFSSKSTQRHIITAKKEVILSAGTFQSPQLLELSGVGDAKLLSRHGIEVVVDHPKVGENLQDHAFVGISFEAAEGVPTADPFLRDEEMLKKFLQMYEKDGSGPLGGFFIPAAQTKLPPVLSSSGDSFLRELMTEVSSGTVAQAGTELDEITMDIFAQEDGATAMHQLARAQFNISDTTKIKKMMAPSTPGDFLTLFVSLNHPFSRGNVHIVSSSVSAKPRIDPKYFSHPMDIEIIARHVQFLSKLLSVQPLAKFFKQGGTRIPSYAFSEGTEMSLEEAKKVARAQMISNYHPSGSCMMAPREKGGVVDERLRVHGVKGLRVVDASIFPVLPRGNIITSVYATAEKAADMIKEDWK